MPRHPLALSIPPLAALLLSLAPPAHADEGQWTPDQIAQIADLFSPDGKPLEQRGLALTPQQLWNPDGERGERGLLRAAVNLSGCSAAFVSARGLIATNHHCAYRALQAQSSPEADYITDGFLATDPTAELEAKGATVQILHRVEDVTEVIGKALAGAKAGPAGDADRARAMARVKKQLIAACESKPTARCDVEGFYGDSQFRLFEYRLLRDIRLVYAPPGAIGEYGGEIDNWMWPRHTGDFTLLRAYVAPDGSPADHAVENVPYEPEEFLPVSSEGVSPGDFVAILGYPGRTQRYLPAAEVERWVDQVLPGYVDLYGEWIEILETHAKADEAVRIKVAALQKSLANRHKNSRGMLGGIEHMKLVAARRAEHQALVAWAKESGKPGDTEVLAALERESALAREQHVRGQLLTMLERAPNLLAVAIHLARRARELAKPDLDRADDYMERNQDRLWRRIERHLRDFDADVDSALLASLVARNRDLPAKQQIAAFTGLAGNIKEAGRDALLPAIGPLFANTTLTDAALIKRLWDDPLAALSHDDPLLDLARALVADAIEPHEHRVARAEGANARLMPALFEMLRAHRSGPIYPDANGTLRFSYATVKGYDKWDGATQTPQTKLAGAVAKHTGAAPFNLPEAVRQAAPEAAKSRFADAALGDVPLCFLSTGDTTGGNSGSPVIDGQGRLVGLNFDRVWENIAGDFAYHDGHSRNISVDIRYLLWMLEEVADAERLLGELGIEPAPPSAPVAASPADAGTAKPASSTAKRSGCGCHVGATEPTSTTASTLMLIMLAGLALLALRRRRRVPARATDAHRGS